MTSRNSFWASCKENHKRRIWVWIVAVLAQLMAYVGVLTVYLSRIRMWNEEGLYRTYEAYQDALYQAARDALGFQDNLLIILPILAVTIGMQGFSYLYDRRKVDLYHSVPVNKNKRFAVVYVNGLMIYLTATLASLLIGVVMAAMQGAVNGEVMAVVGLAFLWNLLFFLVIYHTAIFAVMVTGNRFITLCVSVGLIIYEAGLYMLISNMKHAFFQTVSEFYVSHNPKLSVIYDYESLVWRLKYDDDIGMIAREVLPYYGKWYILAVAVLAAAWWCYSRRPSEAAGKAVAFPKMEPVFKVAAVIPIGLLVGMWVYNAAYSNVMLAAVGMVAGGVIACAFVEVVYDFDIKSMFKHLISSGVAVAGIVVVFLIFKQDLFGYDRYIPDESKVDSVAISVDYYGSFWDENFNYVGSGEFSEEHMHLEDVEPVLALADRARQDEWEDMDDARLVNVLYRLKSGRRVGRCFYVDFSNPANEELMNRIVGTQEFKEGTYQIMTDRESYDKTVGITYSNGATNMALPAEDAQKLREAYVKDMEKVDFSLLTAKRPCGEITFRFPNWNNDRLDVYDTFENTIAYLQSQEAFYPVQLNPEDIADITVTNFHYELNDIEEGSYDSPAERNLAMGAYEAMAVSYSEDTTVSETFFDEEEIAQIMQAVYPAYLSSAWNDSRELDENYDLYVTFKKDTTYPYDRSNFGVYYKFYTGQVPQFVVDRTALEAKE